MRFTLLQRFSSSTNTPACTSKEKGFVDGHKPFSREDSTLERHIDEIKNAEVSVVCAKQGKTILTAKKSPAA